MEYFYELHIDTNDKIYVMAKPHLLSGLAMRFTLRERLTHYQRMINQSLKRCIFVMHIMINLYSA